MSHTREQLCVLVDKFKQHAEKNSINHKRYNTLHYCIGFPQVILTSLLTFYTGTTNFNWQTALGLLSTFLAVTLVFFKPQEQAQKFKNTKLQYLEVISDIENTLFEANEEEMHAMAEMAIEKEKFIQAYEGSGSDCLEWCTVQEKEEVR